MKEDKKHIGVLIPEIKGTLVVVHKKPNNDKNEKEDKQRINIINN